MINKADILAEYQSKCESLSIDRNVALYRHLEEQAIQQEEEKEMAEEGYQIEEGKTLDIIFMGNHKLNFNSRLTDRDMLALVPVYEPHAIFIQHLDLRYNHLTDTGAEALAPLLSGASQLKTLNLQANNIGVEGTRAICEALENHESLLYLNLNGNVIGEKGTEAVVKFLLTCPTLVELDLGNNQIPIKGVIMVTTALNESNFSLEVLNIENPSLSNVLQEAAIHFAKMLAINTSLHKLSLRKHRLKCDGIYTLSMHLLENTTLKVLDLSCNMIAADGAMALGQYLTNAGCSLESLHLGANNLGDLGAQSLAQAIAQNRSVLHIDLTSNNIGDEGLSRLAESFFHNPTLLSFKLFGNNFDQQSLKLFFRLFQTPRDNEWYPDFTTYYVDDAVQMAYIDTQSPYDIYV